MLKADYTKQLDIDRASISDVGKHLRSAVVNGAGADRRYRFRRFSSLAKVS